MLSKAVSRIPCVLPSYQQRCFAIFTNRLQFEKSPYLLQHKHNPVDWWPWCEEVFQKAKEEDKLIFLSVGYSTCHWCHVMEHESFENEETAAIMNKLYYNVKVDREERPDIDKTYMSFIQKIGVGGGWPMSVWLTPTKLPIWGGTYFPPRDMYGRVGFPSVLEQINTIYKQRKEDLEEQGERIIVSLQQNAAVLQAGRVNDSKEIHKHCYSKITENYDEVFGGFGEGPKFPSPPTLNFLLRNYYMYPNSEIGKNGKEMALFTLRKIIEGGIHDHVGGGFHRYSVDKYWHIPHYEKMLYDQAQLACCFLDSFQISGEEIFADAARDIFSYVSENLMHPEGGIYSAEDADSLHSKTNKLSEGAFYVWTYDEIVDALGVGKETDIFCEYYGIEKEGNTRPESDPHRELTGTNTLFILQDLENVAKKYSIDIEDCKDIINKQRLKLKEVRKSRPKPHLDDKIITSWNGLMLSAYANGYKVFGDQAYRVAAEGIAKFVEKYLFVDGGLLRSYREGPSSIPAFATDYAFLIRGLLDLYEGVGDNHWLKWALQLQEKQHSLFWDEEHGGYWNTTKESQILFQSKEVYDGAEPSENSVAYQNMSRISNMLADEFWGKHADRLLNSCHQYLNNAPQIAPEMVAFVSSKEYCRQYVLTGDLEHVTEFIGTIHKPFDPFKVLIYANESSLKFLAPRLPHIKSLHVDEVSVHICEHQTCKPPIFSTQQLKEALHLK